MEHNILSDSWSLSKWLAVKTSHARDLVIDCIESHQPVMSETNCQRLLLAHVHYHQMVKPVYDDPNIKRLLFPFFDIRQPQVFEPKAPRQIVPDLQFSGHGRSVPFGLLPRMGWLYATQFVDFGLTQLLTDPKANHLNLRVDAENRKREWQAFRHDLDVLHLSENEEEALAKAACSALSTYSGIFNSAYRE
jgi:heme oxygenase